MDSIQELIESSKALLNQTNLKSKPKATRGSLSDRVRINYAEPTGLLMKRFRPVNFYSIHIHQPTELPVGLPENACIVLHSHAWGENCYIERWCHQVGYRAVGFEAADFDKVWGYLYNERPLTGLDFKLG